MKHTIRLAMYLLMLVVILFAASCGDGLDQAFAPFNFPGSTWRCKIIGASFTVDDNDKYAYKGVLNLNGEDENVIYYVFTQGDTQGRWLCILDENDYNELKRNEKLYLEDCDQRALFCGYAEYGKGTFTVKYPESQESRTSVMVPYPHIFGEQHGSFVFQMVNNE